MVGGCVWQAGDAHSAQWMIPAGQAAFVLWGKKSQYPPC